MNKKGDWVKPFTSDLISNMKETIKKAYGNAESLLEDAQLLLENRRYSRSTALAILSEEEFSKSFILLVCLGQQRWDSNIYKALRAHATKQGISEAAREHYNWAIENIKMVEEMNKTSFIKNEPALIPDEERLNDLKDLASSRFKKPIKDHLKQDSFYVSLDKDSKIISTPEKITEINAKQTIEEAKDFKSATKALMRANSL